LPKFPKLSIKKSGKAAFSPTVVKHRCVATDRTTAKQFPDTAKSGKAALKSLFTKRPTLDNFLFH